MSKRSDDRQAREVVGYFAMLMLVEETLRRGDPISDDERLFLLSIVKSVSEGEHPAAQLFSTSEIAKGMTLFRDVGLALLYERFRCNEKAEVAERLTAERAVVGVETVRAARREWGEWVKRVVDGIDTGAVEDVGSELSQRARKGKK